MPVTVKSIKKSTDIPQSKRKKFDGVHSSNVRTDVHPEKLQSLEEAE